MAHKIILTATNELENKVKLVVSLEELDHVEDIGRLAALMVHFDFAKDLNSKSQLELFRKSSKLEAIITVRNYLLAPCAQSFVNNFDGVVDFGNAVLALVDHAIGALSQHA